jgi:hypothetical protein
MLAGKTNGHVPFLNMNKFRTLAHVLLMGERESTIACRLDSLQSTKSCELYILLSAIPITSLGNLAVVIAQSELTQ